MSGYPTPESIKPREPRVQANYPPPNARQGVRKVTAPTAVAGPADGKAPLPSTRAPIEDDSESEVNETAQFRYAPAPAFKADGRDLVQPRRRAGSRAPIDMGEKEGGREDGGDQDSNGEQAPMQHQT